MSSDLLQTQVIQPQPALSIMFLEASLLQAEAQVEAAQQMEQPTYLVLHIQAETGEQQGVAERLLAN